MDGVTIKDAAERSGLTPGAIRMWEQRYGFPVPRRTAAGHRRYDSGDIETLRRALALRDQGLSVAAALERARDAAGETDRPSIYGAIVGAAGIPVRPSSLHKRTLIQLSRAIEDEAMTHAAAPVCFASFQREAFFRDVEHRYRRMAVNADCVLVFADFAEQRRSEAGIVEIPDDGTALGSEWAVVVDAPGYAACLVAWERADTPPEEIAEDRERRFEALVSLDPSTVRAAARAAARAVRAADAELGARVERLLADRPLAFERPVPSLTALTNRMLSYVDGEGGGPR
jgi:DICT domain-containing protein